MSADENLQRNSRNVECYRTYRTTFCKSGRIPGAVKNGKSWQIPDDARKPVDGRVSSGKYVKKNQKKGLRALPIGISDYVRA